jgi:hypothetical protein
MVGAVVTAAIGGAAQVVQTAATKLIIDRMDSDWKKSPEARKQMVKRLAQLAENRSTLGFNKTDLDRDSYAESPILARMNSLIFAGGDIRVAYVPNGLGKSSACRAFLRAGLSPPGIAFCVNQENATSYAASMLKYLKLDAVDPPEGWMDCLLEALKGLDKLPVLILDDFMNYGVTEHDKSFLVCLKSLIRSSTVTAIVLTSNKDAANDMLTWNGMEGIIPMVDNETVAEFQCAFLAGNFAMDWNKELNMKWSTEALQVAAAVDPRHKHLDPDAIRNKVKDHLDSLRPDRRKVASPGKIHRVLMTELGPPTRPSAAGGHVIATFDSVEENSGFGVCGASSCGENCLVM